MWLACGAASVVLAVPTLLGLCAYNSISQAVGLKRRLRLRRVVEFYLLMCVASAAYSSVLPQDTLLAKYPESITRASGWEPTLPERAVSPANHPLWTISAPQFLINLRLPTLSPLLASYSLRPADATVTMTPTWLLQPSSISWGSTSCLLGNSDSCGATSSLADDSCTDVAVYPQADRGVRFWGRTRVEAQLPAPTFLGEAKLSLACQYL